MVPDVTKKGHSFKGALLYYLHDKREAGQQEKLLSSERVAWTETRNVATADPVQAQAIMIATARQADALKAAAGIKATGRKSNAHVYAYSLSWRADEIDPEDRAEMVRAVDASLKALGADHLQAVIVCHRDRKHPHVHVVINRVDPATGKMHGFSKDHEILSAWARAYEEQRGLIVTPARKKAEPEDAAAPAKKPVADPRAEKPAADPRPKSKAAQLAEFQAAQKARHAQEWKDLAAANKARRASIYAAADREMKAAIVAQKEADKPIWAAMFKTERKARQDFEKAQRSILGTISYALALAVREPRGGGQDKGFLSVAFGFMISSAKARASFEARMNEEKASLVLRMRNRPDTRPAMVKEARQRQLADASTKFAADRSALIERQKAERAKVSAAWKDIYAGKNPRDRGTEQAAQKRQQDRKRAAFDARFSEQNYRYARRLDRKTHPTVSPKSAATGKPPAASSNMERVPMDKDFDKARQIPQPVKVQTVPTWRAAVSHPVPAPAPSGEVPARPKQRQDVPQIDRAAEWAKTPDGQKAMQEMQKTQAPERGKGPADFRANAAPPEAKPPVRPAERPERGKMPETYAKAARPAEPVQKVEKPAVPPLREAFPAPPAPQTPPAAEKPSLRDWWDTPANDPPRAERGMRKDKDRNNGPDFE